MNREKATVCLRWPGSDTLKAARAAIRSGAGLQIELPLEVHYSLHKHLYPDGAPHASENVDASGGAELLGPIAAVAGLEDLKQLESALRRGHYHVRLTSPDPRLILTPPER